MALPPRLARYARLVDLLVEALVRDAVQESETATPGSGERSPLNDNGAVREYVKARGLEE